MTLTNELLQPAQNRKQKLSTVQNINVIECSRCKDFLDRIGHALNIYHTQYYTDELTDTIFFVTQQKYAGVNTSSNSIYYLFMTFRVLASKQSKQARDDPIAMFLLR